MSAIGNLFVSVCLIYIIIAVYFFVRDIVWTGWGRW